MNDKGVQTSAAASTEKASSESASLEGGTTSETSPLTIDTAKEYLIRTSDGKEAKMRGDKLLQQYHRGNGYSNLQSQYDTQNNTLKTLVEDNNKLREQLLERERDEIKKSIMSSGSMQRGAQQEERNGRQDYSWLTGGEEQPQQQQTINPDALQAIVDRAYQSGLSEDVVRNLVREELNSYSQDQNKRQSIEKDIEARMNHLRTQIIDRYNVSPEKAQGVLSRIEGAMESLRLAHSGIDPGVNYELATKSVLDELLPELLGFAQENETRRRSEEKDAAMLSTLGNQTQEEDSEANLNSYDEAVRYYGERGRKRFKQIRSVG